VRCRFLDKVEQTSGCWLWRGSRHGKGYGHFRVGGDIHKAHRIAYEIFRGSVSDGLLVCHACDNPACVNPAHLWLGTNDENLDDRQRKHRQAHGERHSRAVLTESDVLAIRGAVEPIVVLAERYGVTLSTIRHAKLGLSWKHLPMSLHPARCRAERRILASKVERAAFATGANDAVHLVTLSHV